MSAPTYDPPIPLERLDELMQAVQSGAALDAETRAGIVDALEFLYVALAVDERQHSPGRPQAVTWHYARLTAELVDRYGASVKAAARAAAPGVDESITNRIERTYRKLRKQPKDWQINLDVIERAAARLTAKRKQ